MEVEKNAIPAIDFLELYDVKEIKDLNVTDRWQKADTSKSLAVPLGVRGKDDIVYLNLHERAHGPHGLVAGTTGSGKSEIVQSYMLSLAVNFAPEDVGFYLLILKGGGMANLFAKLPHLLGSITNLDGASSARALQSISVELQKITNLDGASSARALQSIRAELQNDNENLENTGLTTSMVIRNYINKEKLLTQKKRKTIQVSPYPIYF